MIHVKECVDFVMAAGKFNRSDKTVESRLIELENEIRRQSKQQIWAMLKTSEDLDQAIREVLQIADDPEVLFDPDERRTTNRRRED